MASAGPYASQTDNHASTPPLCFLQAGCPSCRPTNSVKALKASKDIMHTKSANLANRKNRTGIIHTITILTANRILQLWQKWLLTAEHVKRVSPSEYRNKVDDHIILIYSCWLFHQLLADCKAAVRKNLHVFTYDSSNNRLLPVA